MSRHSPSSRRGRRGQVLVLACVTFLTLALMMLASFAVANAVHERIRIQAAADAQAFSVAIIEARAFNTMAYTNRAIAGALVSEMALHAWKAIAERDASMLRAGFFSFLQVAAAEFGKCSKKKKQHCWHGLKALKIAFKYKKKASQVKNQIQSKEQQFRQAVTDLNDAIKSAHSAQNDMLKNAKKQMMSNSDLLTKILKETAPQATGANLADFNTSDFACALEGSSFDDDCKDRAWKPKGSVSSPDKRRDIIESAAMAARAPFEAGKRFGRGLSGDDYKGGSTAFTPFVNNPDVAMNIQGEGSFREMAWDHLEAQVGNDQVKADVKQAVVTVSWKHGSGFWFSEGQAQSGNPYRGVPCNGQDCFINFRFNPGGDETDDGQPATYGGVRQDLRKTRDEKLGQNWDTARPWELNKDGKVSVQLTKDQPAELQMVSTRQGYAVGKGKTYFHQLGDWGVPPNMFDPFWRAKLHPFKREELSAVLGVMGDSAGQEIVDNTSSVVEGRFK